MAVKTKDKIININDLKSDLTITKPKETALYFKNKTYAQAISSLNVVGDNLEIITTNNNHKLILTDYFKQNGKNAIKYIKTDETEETGFLRNLIELGLVTNPNAIISPQKGNTFTGTVFNDSITGTDNKDIIKANEGNDTLTGSLNDDIITLGKGVNTIDYTTVSNGGNDTVNLTKGETLNIIGLTFNNVAADNRYKQHSKNKSDLLITHDKGTITLKNYYAKDLGATVIVNGEINPVINPVMAQVTSSYFEGSTKKQTKYIGSALADNVDASGLQNAINPKKNTGVTINTSAGNDSIRGSKFADVITGGIGQNTIKYHTANEMSEDKIYLTKGENLIIDISDFASNAEYKVNKNNLEITAGGKTLTIMNFGSKDVTNNATKTTSDTSSVELKTSTGTINLRTELLSQLNITKNYTGTWHADNISAAGYINSKNNKGLTIDGKAGNDLLIGSNYDDVIKAGTKGNSTISGGKSSDKLYGGSDLSSRTTFLFNTGDGLDTVFSGKGDDTINLSGINIADVDFTRGEGKALNDLIIKYTNTDSVTIKDYYKKQIPLNI